MDTYKRNKELSIPFKRLNLNIMKLKVRRTCLEICIEKNWSRGIKERKLFIKIWKAKFKAE